MPNTNQWHLILTGIIAVELLTLLALSRPAKTGHANGDHPRHHVSPVSVRPEGAETNDLPVEIAKLTAEKQALEEQIRSLNASSETSENSLKITAEFIAQRRFGRPDDPFSRGGETRQLLRVTDEEGDRIDAVRDRTLARVKEIESARVHQETRTDGSPYFTVSPWPDQGEPLMRAFEAKLISVLGQPRAAILFPEIRDSTFIRGGSVELQISPNTQTQSDSPFSLPGESDAMHLELTLSDGDSGEHLETLPIWLYEENTPDFLLRFGHVLGVGNAEELQALFKTPTGE